MMQGAVTCIGIIGVGRLGSALAEGLVRARVVPRILLCGRDSSAVDSLVGQSSICVKASAMQVASESDVILLAVKPADISTLSAELLPLLQKREVSPIIVSVAAGISILQLQSALPSIPVVRVMPTIGVAIGKGSIGVYAEDIASKQLVGKVFSSLGDVLQVTSEQEFDAVLAVAASGLGFLAYIAEGLVAGGEAVGLSTEQAQRCVAAVFQAAGGLLQEKQLSPEALCSLVASPKGTTRAGLAELESAHIHEALVRAVQAATQRSKELQLSHDNGLR